ncbi:ABC transporter substrate-binding protein [Rhodobacteraceae bacterium RKSG542]|uniref:ABC transporter substrate-binding protein n=1 Tax=Pseudovibrio flavus TaxID=2529854 RepID=UPI0012BBB582|nr:ABC transporter substrate-binding protein [Pseudovibrio flavus]MTI18963.1 ABC transporter substrate-binding protein [Pseudovibrio flavus]
MRSLIASIAVLVMLTGSASAIDRKALHIHSATDTEAFLPIIKGFEARYPEYVVEYSDYNTNDLYKRVTSTKASSEEPIDIVISPAMDLQVKLVNSGFALKLNMVGSEELPTWAKWRDELFGFTLEPAAIVYNKEAFREMELPETHSDLASMIRDYGEMFDRRIGTYDIRSSGIGYLFATQDAIQGAQAFRLTESLGRARAGLFCCTSTIVEKVARGELILGYNVIGSYALAAVESNPDVGILFLKDYTLAMSRSAFVHHSSQNKKGARLFLEFLLSGQGQTVLAQNSALLPRQYSTATRFAPYADTTPLVPIKIGPALLTYLDGLKKSNFLENWEASINWTNAGP